IVGRRWAWLKCLNWTPWSAPLRMPTFSSRCSARKSRRSASARIARSWSGEKIVRSTPRLRGGRVGRAGSPCRRPERTAHSKKPFRIEMFFAPRAGRGVAPLLVDELLEALGPDGRLEVREFWVGEVARQLVKAALVGLVGVRE